MTFIRIVRRSFATCKTLLLRFASSRKSTENILDTAHLFSWFPVYCSMKSQQLVFFSDLWNRAYYARSAFALGLRYAIRNIYVAVDDLMILMINGSYSFIHIFVLHDGEKEKTLHYAVCILCHLLMICHKSLATFFKSCSSHSTSILFTISKINKNYYSALDAGNQNHWFVELTFFYIFGNFQVRSHIRLKIWWWTQIKWMTKIKAEPSAI